jgi:hypothetical protein
MMAETHRIWGVTSEEKFKQIEQWAKEMSISTATFTAIAVWVGAKELSRMFDLSPEVEVFRYGKKED